MISSILPYVLKDTKVISIHSGHLSLQPTEKLKPEILFFKNNNISYNPDKELQPQPDDQKNSLHYPENVPTTGEDQLLQPAETFAEDSWYPETTETIGEEQAQQPA